MNAEAHELRISADEPDAERALVTVWFVTVDGNIYVRNGAAYGEPSVWFRRALRLRTGRMESRDGIRRVRLLPVAVDDPIQPRIDDAYLAKYGTRSMNGEANWARTLLVTPIP